MAELWIDDVPVHQLGMSRDFANWIQANCVCSFCGASLPEDLTPCSCDKNDAPFVKVRYSEPEDLDEVQLHSVQKIDGVECYVTEFSRLWGLNRERLHRMAKQARRQRPIVHGGKKSTKEEKQALLEVHNYKCFYCGRQLQAESGVKKYHFDHYISLANGGTDGLENIVCACSECNLKKSMENGPQFSAAVTKSLNLEMKIEVRKLRAKVRAYKKKWLFA